MEMREANQQDMELINRWLARYQTKLDVLTFKVHKEEGGIISYIKVDNKWFIIDDR